MLYWNMSQVKVQPPLEAKSGSWEKWRREVIFELNILYHLEPDPKKSVSGVCDGALSTAALNAGWR